MAFGPGKYDKECRQAHDLTGADAVMLVVVSGSKGHGVSMTMRADKIVDMQPMPSFLRELADRIERGPPY